MTGFTVIVFLQPVLAFRMWNGQPARHANWPPSFFGFLAVNKNAVAGSTSGVRSPLEPRESTSCWRPRSWRARSCSSESLSISPRRLDSRLDCIQTFSPRYCKFWAKGTMERGAKNYTSNFQIFKSMDCICGSCVATIWLVPILSFHPCVWK